MSGPSAGHERLARAALYLGGFLGPFGGGVIVVLIPELQRTFDASPGAVTAGLTAYLLPFAALQLVSGTIGERLGRRRTIRWAFLAYAVTSFGVALTPSIVPFLVLRACQGAANAFTSPLLLAALAESATEERLGRSMGTFAAVQTAGMVIAPLCGGLLGAIEPRLAFAVPGVVALLLVAAPLPAGTHARARRARACATRSTAARRRSRRPGSSPTSRSTASRSSSRCARPTPSGSTRPSAACSWPGSASRACSRDGRRAGWSTAPGRGRS